MVRLAACLGISLLTQVFTSDMSAAAVPPDVSIGVPGILPGDFDRTVVPGVRVGPLVLGDSEDHVRGLLAQPDREQELLPGSRLLVWKLVGLDVTLVAGKLVRIRVVGDGWRVAGLALPSPVGNWMAHFPDLQTVGRHLVSGRLGLGVEHLQTDRGDLAVAAWVMIPSPRMTLPTQDLPSLSR